MTQFHKIQIQDLSAPELEVYVGLKEVQLLHYFEPERGILWQRQVRLSSGN